MTKTEIRNFIQSIADVKITFSKSGWWYDNEREVINVDLTDFNDMGFMRHLNEVHKCEFAYEYSLTLWSILHEIGHYYTLDDVEEDDEDDRIALMLTTSKIANNKKIQDRYFNMPSEWTATEWAIQFIKNNRQYLTSIKI